MLAINVQNTAGILAVGTQFYNGTQLMTIQYSMGGAYYQLTTPSTTTAVTVFFTLSPPTTCSAPVASNALQINTFTV